MADADGLDAELALAVGAAREAGALVLARFNTAVRRWDKSPGNPVCEADLAADALLTRRLRGSRPEYGWLSEETADAPERLSKRRVWVVDPIDGTRDFLRGRTGFAVSVALVEDGEPVIAALYAPALDTMYAAAKRRGATRDGAPIRVSSCDAVEGCRIPADAATIGARWWPEPWRAVAVDKPNGLALRLAKVASGDADAFFEGRPMGEWDIAAAALIVAEAGGAISDRDGRPLRFNCATPKPKGVVAAAPAIHAEVLRRVALGIRALEAARARPPPPFENLTA